MLLPVNFLAMPDNVALIPDKSLGKPVNFKIIHVNEDLMPDNGKSPYVFIEKWLEKGDPACKKACPASRTGFTWFTEYKVLGLLRLNENRSKIQYGFQNEGEDQLSVQCFRLRQYTDLVKQLVLKTRQLNSYVHTL